MFLQSRNTPEQAGPGADTPLSENKEGQSLVTVTYTDSGYSPGEVVLLIGGTVTFQNESSREMWIASAMHPIHATYPGSGIQKCGTPEAPRIFDACKGIAPGESWSFTFQEHGSWGYHDHLKINNTGKIIVE